MKQLFILFALAGCITASAQSNSAPEGFSNGSFINNRNEKTEGFIKESFKKGSIMFTTINGGKKNYTPADIIEFTIGADAYIAYLNDFYKVATAGTKVMLLQKVTNNSGKMLYNGTEAYPASTTEGKPGDYYLHINASDKVALVTKDNFEKVFATFCASCATLLTNIEGKQIDYASIEKAVDQYNNCK